MSKNHAWDNLNKLEGQRCEVISQCDATKGSGAPEATSKLRSEYDHPTSESKKAPERIPELLSKPNEQLPKLILDHQSSFRKQSQDGESMWRTSTANRVPLLKC